MIDGLFAEEYDFDELRRTTAGPEEPKHDDEGEDDEESEEEGEE